MSTITILDGGTATELVRLGFPAINSDPLWSARLLHTNPEAVKQAHRNFFTKGSDIVVTASYQASVAGFVEHLGVTEEGAVLLIKRSVHLARQAADEVSKDLGCKNGRVAGSVGPYGACLHDGSEYTGNYIEGLSDKELQAWHRPRIGALLEAGADLLAIETIPCQREAELVVKLLECEFPSSQAWVTFSCKVSDRDCWNL
ncbi:homocysteine S-methyltransferase YbgG-like isoform X2 [Dreissena polymorpha]|uniref:homocysteine S-methyltransferase YbgG-like isoform X2 n=1 Tax=Dreissena polymorpha TaxID=45954 RepID=UPI002264E4A2|nr:homocysteine S-methyltransferase YbgG-like isoform X2 [Dreissena polymorpha]